MPKVKKLAAKKSRKWVLPLTPDELAWLTARARVKDPLASAVGRLVAFTRNDPALTSARLRDAACRRLKRDLRRLVVEHGRLTLDLVKRYERSKRREKKSIRLPGKRAAAR